MSDDKPFVWRPAAAPLHRVDFVSDLHLSAALPRTTAAFAQFIRSTPADAVVILGDFFEVWVGDDARHDSWESELMAVLSDATKRRPLAFMVGNRDFLIGVDLLAATGMCGLPDPTVLEVAGQRLLCSHGDALCVDDLPYQAFRRMVRTPAWQVDFLAQPLSRRRQIAADIRRESQFRRDVDGSTEVDVDADAARQWLREAGANVLVHGHTHRPGEHGLGHDPIQTRIVLSDWDLDDAHRPRAEVLVWDSAGPRRMSPTDACF